MSGDLLSRLQRNTIIACAAIAAVALVVDPGRPAAALGVIGGGVLVAISYAAVAYTISALLEGRAPAADARKQRKKQAFAVLVFAGHYALLALAAYVMIARLRLHPIGLLGGVTSIVLAAAAEARRPRA